MKTIKVLVADDQIVIQLGIKAMLDECEEIELVGFAKNARETIDLFNDTIPDVLLLDLIMPDSYDLSLAKHILSLNPNIKIIILTISENLEYVAEAIKIGVRGYLSKSALSEDLSWSIHLVNQGYSTFKANLLQGCLLESGYSKQLIPAFQPKQKLDTKKRGILFFIYKKINFFVDKNLDAFFYWLDRQLSK